MYQFVETRSAATSLNAIQQLSSNRSKVARSVQDFPFNRKRLKVLSESREVVKNSNGIIYWMSRNQRVEDNWTLLYSQSLALRNSLPLHVVFCLAETFLDATFRHYKFMLEGLKEVEHDCRSLNINFHLLRGQAAEQIPTFTKKYKMGAVVADSSPLRIHREWVEDIRKNIAPEVPFIQVDR